MPRIDPRREGISFTRRGDKIEAPFNIPKADLPESANFLETPGSTVSAFVAFSARTRDGFLPSRRLLL